MTQHTVETLLAHAFACGKEYAAGAVASSNTLQSARVKAIIPAMEAIEAGHVTFDNELPRKITKAYSDGTGLEYSGRSETTAVNKTAQFLIAASKGFGLSTLSDVQAFIAGINDKTERDKASRGIFEKLVPLFNKSIEAVSKGSVHIQGSELRAFLLPVAPELSKDEALAKAFDKAAKLVHEIAKMSDQYTGLAATALQFERHSDEHAARAKRAADQAAPVSPLAAPAASQPATVQPVTLQSDEPETDTVDELLAA